MTRLQQRALVQVLRLPCDPYAWYELAKATKCKTMADLEAIAGQDWLLTHSEAAVSGLSLRLDLYAEATPCRPHTILFTWDKPPRHVDAGELLFKKVAGKVRHNVEQSYRSDTDLRLG